jgi:hypothetical protein
VCHRKNVNTERLPLVKPAPGKLHFSYFGENNRGYLQNTQQCISPKPQWKKDKHKKCFSWAASSRNISSLFYFEEQAHRCPKTYNSAAQKNKYKK